MGWNDKAFSGHVRRCIRGGDGACIARRRPDARLSSLPGDASRSCSVRCSSIASRCTVAALLAVSGPARVWAQTPGGQLAPQVFTLSQAMQYAVDHYPTIRAALEQVNASSAGVDVARAGYLPRLDSLWQSNRGTTNNIFGQVLPQSVIPAL